MNPTTETCEKQETKAAQPETGEAELRLEKRRDGQLWLVRDGKEDVAVGVRRPFPWSAPDRYVSFRDEKEVEVFLLDDLAVLDADSRRVLDEALGEASFVLDVESIESIETEFEIRNWKVATTQGPYTFQTKHDDWPRPLAEGGILIRDIEGNLFRVADPRAMDEKSRKLLWAFFD